MPQLRVTELDFLQIKSNLQAFMSAQSEFQDYDFTGSALSVLLDVLAYNTHYNAVLAHMVANEMFIDTAIKRSSVISLAKMLGYVPRSAVSARASVRIVITPTGTQNSMTITPSNSFTASINGEQFTFSPATSYTALKENGVFTFDNVVLVEGIRLSNTFVVRPDTLSGPFTIPVETIDVSSLVIDVSDNLLPVAYRRANTIVDVGPTDRVFWVEEATTGRYQIIFGDNIIGKQLTAGNVVQASYIVCAGSRPNGARTFSTNGAILGETNILVTTLNPSASGAFKEEIDEIRRNAPKFNATRNRVVTAQDYKTLILSEFPRVKSVVTWGGEENNPPIFGRVFITLDPKDGEIITDTDKDFISEAILRPRAVMSIQHQFVDPDYIFLGFAVKISYNSRNTTLSTEDIRSFVQEAIEEYFVTELQSLEKGFVYSQFIDYIQRQFEDGVLVSVLVDMTVQRRLNLLETRQTSGTINLLTPLRKNTIRSTNFLTIVNDVEYTAYVRDLPPADTTQQTGTLQLVDETTGNVLVSDVGLVDYLTGLLTYNNISITGYLGEAQDWRIAAQPQTLSTDIFTTIVRTTAFTEYAVSPLPSRNTIIVLDDSTPDAPAGLAAGLKITVTPTVV
jgi:hypothetical protein